MEPITFENVTPEQFDRIEKRLDALGYADKAEDAANAGDAQDKGVKIGWKYDAGTQQLTIRCIKKPFFVSGEMLGKKIREAFKEQV